MFTLIALLSTATAEDDHDYAGGGLVLHPAWIGEIGPSNTDAGLLQCIGGMGIEVRGMLRTGGEGHWCGNGNAGLGWGGGQFGVFAGGPIYGSAFATVGGGWIGAGDLDRPDYAAAVLMVKPTLAAGLSAGFFALELGLYANAALPIVQWEGGDNAFGPGFSYAGGQVALLFGEFWPHRRATQSPPPPRTATTRDDDRPLAIPGPPPPGEPAYATAPQQEADSAQDALDKAAADLEAAAESLDRAVRDALDSETADDVKLGTAKALDDTAEALRRASESLREQVEENEEEDGDEQEGPPPKPNQ